MIKIDLTKRNRYYYHNYIYITVDNTVECEHGLPERYICCNSQEAKELANTLNAMMDEIIHLRKVTPNENMIDTFYGGFPDEDELEAYVYFKRATRICYHPAHDWHIPGSREPLDKSNILGVMPE